MIGGGGRGGGDGLHGRLPGVALGGAREVRTALTL